MDTGLLATVRPIVAEIAAASAQSAVPIERRTVYQRAFIQEMNLWQRNETIAQLTRSTVLARAAAQLMGVDGVRLYHDQALVKQGGGGATPWHCDQYYWPLDTDRTITAWIPLHDVPLEMGPLIFSVGSHCVDMGRSLPIGDESDAAVRRHPSWRSRPQSESAMSIGDVSFHSGWTFHGANGNTTDRPRHVFTVIYMADGTALAEPRTDAQRRDRARWLPGSVVGQRIDSPLNPLLWPAR
jgi:ectoine hydroxylase-related dioxygenase (phytanoyl-CoA dioxygenase family)